MIYNVRIRPFSSRDVSNTIDFDAAGNRYAAAVKAIASEINALPGCVVCSAGGEVVQVRSLLPIAQLKDVIAPSFSIWYDIVRVVDFEGLRD